MGPFSILTNQHGEITLSVSIIISRDQQRASYAILYGITVNQSRISFYSLASA